MNNRVINDPYLKDCCAICEAYTGDDHFYGDCTRCPAYRMAIIKDCAERLKRLGFDCFYEEDDHD